MKWYSRFNLVQDSHVDVNGRMRAQKSRSNFNISQASLPK